MLRARSSLRGSIDVVRPIASYPFLSFLALSIAIHALLLGAWVELHPREEPIASTVLNAELLTLDPARVPVPAAAVPVAPKAPPRAPQPTRPAAPDPTAITVPQPAFVAEPEVPEPEIATAEPQAPEPEIATAEPQAPEPEVAAAEPGESAPEAAPVAAAPQPVPAPPAADAPTSPIVPVRDLPQSGSQSYEVFIGSGRLHIGRTLQTWTIDDQTYRLSSSSETTGLAGFIRPYQLDYVSEGRVDASGFHPESFSVRRGRNGTRQYAARFDWNAGELTLGPVSAPRKVALPGGTLDVLAFIYQLSRAQLAPGRVQVSVTTGNRLETYTLEIGAEEDMEVPTGTIRALPVRQLRKPGQESMEIWLAPDRQYLPVRIRFLDRNGEISGEQLAADIAFVDAR